MIKSGIYKITNTITNKVYIGSSVNVISRIRQHENALKTNKHVNKHLQNSFNMYGINSFMHECIEIVENLDDLLVREQYWLDSLDSYNPSFGYNECKIAGNTLGRVKSEEEKEKTAGFNNRNSKLSEEIAFKIMKEYLLGDKTQIEISKLFNLSTCIVSKFLNGKTYKKVYNLLTEQEKLKIKQLNKTYKESTQKIKKSLKRKDVSDETKNKHRVRGKKYHEQNPNYFKSLFKGRKHTKETKALISKKKKGIKISKERLEKIKNINRDYMTAENNWNSVLTYEKAKEIRRIRFEEKLSIKELANIFGVSEPTIKRVLYNKTYKENNGTEKESVDN